MPGRAALTDIAGVKSDIMSIQKGENPAGAGKLVAGGMEATSKIGGEGRMGGDAYGSLTDPMYTRIDAEVVSGGATGAMATKGQAGIGGDGTLASHRENEMLAGRTFTGRGRKRKED
jgi:hypothetical protein